MCQLNGCVAQVIILARESGLKLELSDIPVQTLVPEPLKASKMLTSTWLFDRGTA